MTREHHTGRRVVALDTNTLAFGPDFPGWGQPGAIESLRAIVEGTLGTITRVEHHGNAPYTRYAVQFDNDTHAGGLALGQDIRFIA